MLNIKDKKLIYELDTNAFQSNAQIAKKINLSKQVVGNRIKNLKNKNIIKKIYTIINLEKLGYSGQKIYFQMQNLNKKREKEIINYFNNHKKIVWFGLYEGRFDFVISLFEKNKVEFDKSLTKILSDLKEEIVDFEITTYTGALALKKKYLVDKKSNEEFSYFGGYENIISIDEKDKKILKKLSENARISSVELTKDIDLSPDAIIKRIKNLKQKGIIQGSRVMLNKKLVKIHEFKLLIKLKNYNEETHKKFIAFSKLNKYIVAYIKCIGSWNLELDIELPDLNQLHELLTRIKTEFSNSIKTIETLMLHEEHKYNFYPF